jgi:hypothetical protein
MNTDNPTSTPSGDSTNRDEHSRRRSELSQAILVKIVSRLLLTHNWRTREDWKRDVRFLDVFLCKAIPVDEKLREANWKDKVNVVLIPWVGLKPQFSLFALIRNGKFEPQDISSDDVDRLCEGVTFTETDLTDDNATKAFVDNLDRTVTALIKAGYGDYVAKNSSRIKPDQLTPPGQRTKNLP